MLLGFGSQVGDRVDGLKGQRSSHLSPPRPRRQLPVLRQSISGISSSSLEEGLNWISSLSVTRVTHRKKKWLRSLFSVVVYHITNPCSCPPNSFHPLLKKIREHIPKTSYGNLLSPHTPMEKGVLMMGNMKHWNLSTKWMKHLFHISVLKKLFTFLPLHSQEGFHRTMQRSPGAGKSFIYETGISPNIPQEV